MFCGGSCICLHREARSEPKNQLVRQMCSDIPEIRPWEIARQKSGTDVFSYLSLVSFYFCVCVLIFFVFKEFFFLPELRTKPRALCLLGRHSTTELRL